MARPKVITGRNDLTIVVGPTHGQQVVDLKDICVEGHIVARLYYKGPF